MNIRYMTIEDYPQVYQLWISTPGMGLNDLDDSPEGIEKYLKRNPRTCFVAQKGEEIVGAILAGHDGRRGFIYHTAVSEEYRRRGVGRRLTEAVLEALEAEGIHKAALVVFAKNDLGNAFWESMGFEPRTDLTYRNKIIHQLQRIDT